MKAKELELHVGHIKAYSHALIEGIRVMDQRRYILEPLLYDEDIRNALNAKFKRNRGVEAFNHLVPLLAQDILRDLARLFFLDEGKKAASFLNLYKKVSEPKLRSKLRENYSHIPDQLHGIKLPIDGLTGEESEIMLARINDNDRNDFANYFDEHWSVIGCAVKDLRADVIANKIKMFRDKHHAHLEMASFDGDPGPFNISSIGLTFNDILSFTDRYTPFAYKLALLLTGNDQDIDGILKKHQSNGRDMWCILAGLKERQV